MPGNSSSIDRVSWIAGALGAETGGAFDLTEDGTGVQKADVAGHPADRVDLLGEIQAVIEGFARALARIHSLPTEQAPLDVGWTALHLDIEHQLDQLDPKELPDPYSRYGARELFGIWTAGRPSVEDLVVCHGNPQLENVLLHQGTLAGFRDLTQLRIADRHLDLAIAHASIHRRFGGDASFIFYDAYGTDPDLIRLDHYTLATHLLANQPPSSS